ncbi:Uncharacterised protein [Nocardia farcinica]|uniref:hypothetical protein n=1 Tax=Nocardia farcinica TaxID=37329 RepID=UPI000E0032EF|nr:hypothetical protein [Nocardia farcinica]SUE28944.1 Uncharacterised protein [Nocardia farcinica]
MEEIEWQEDLPGGVRCVNEVLGLDFASALDGTPVTVHMPGLPAIPGALPLTQPTALLGRFELPLLGWGAYPPDAGLVLVNRIGFTATVSDPQIVGDAMNDWALHFLSWLDILTGQHLTPVGFRPPQQAENRTCLVVRGSDGSLFHDPVFRPLPRLYPLRQLDATVEMIEHCCALAGVKEQVPMPWMLLRDARALHRVVQTRRAVIECGSAAEMAIKSFLNRRNVSIPRNKRTLGPLSELLEDDGYPLPPDFDTSFLRVRNREVHMNPGWGSVSEAESLRMLEIAVALVEDAFPLPRGMKIAW